jgi:hypothetical protein
MEKMDSKHESPFTAIPGGDSPAYGQRFSEPRNWTAGDFEPGSVRTLVFFLVSWAIIAFAIWAALAAWPSFGGAPLGVHTRGDSVTTTGHLAGTSSAPGSRSKQLQPRTTDDDEW